MQKIKYYLPVIVWMSIIFFFSTLQVHPSEEIDIRDYIFKKTAHVTEYFILYVLIYRALVNTTSLIKSKIILISFIYVSSYAISDEIHQSFTPTRTPSPKDIGYDTLGSVLAYLFVWKYLPHKAPKVLKKLGKILQII